MDEIDLTKTAHVLHVLRNPHGWNDHVVRDVRLAAADLIERLHGSLMVEKQWRKDASNDAER
jgi:hypothetical protein